MGYEDPPDLRVVVRGLLGAAALLATVALLGVLVASRHIEWRLVTFLIVLWSAYSFFDALLGTVVEPLGRFLHGQFTGSDLPGVPRLTIDQEAATLERLLATDPPPPAHRTILAGIRLAEIYRVHEHDAAKADALLGRLATQYPDAPELRYVRPAASG